MHLMLALDESRYGETIVKWIKAFPHPTGARLTLVHVVEPLDIPEALLPGDRHALERNRQAEVRRLLERAAAHLQDSYAKLDVRVQEGLPIYEVLRLVHEERPDIIVAGTRGLQGGKGFVLGSLSQRLLHYAPCSVLLIPAHAKPRGSMRVCLATDGSAGAQEAARVLTVLPGLQQITVMTVVRPVEARDMALYAASRQQPARAIKAELSKARQAAGQRAIENTIGVLQASGAKLKTLIATGHAAEVIGGMAQREKADLLVLGSRGLTGKTAITMGSVSLAAAQQTPCPILIVKPGA